MFHFAWIWMFALLPLPWIIRYAFNEKKETTGGVLVVPFYHRLIASRSGKNVKKIFYWENTLMALIWLCMVLAIVRPEWLGHPIPIERNGRDIMLAIDISGSMGAADLNQGDQQQTRLDVVREVASTFVNARVGDRIGLVLFGTRAYLQTPLTFDRKTVVAMLDDASIGLAGPQTAIGDSIGISIKRLLEEPEEDRVLILLTDGASNAGSVSPIEAAKLSAKEKIKIYTVGLGADSVTVNTLFGPQRVNPSRDLDEETLKEIAKVTGGLYFRAKDQAGLQKVYEAINQLEPLAGESDMFQPILPLYPWPLGFALLLSLLLGCIVRGRIL